MMIEGHLDNYWFWYFNGALLVLVVAYTSIVYMKKKSTHFVHVVGKIKKSGYDHCFDQYRQRAFKIDVLYLYKVNGIEYRHKMKGISQNLAHKISEIYKPGSNIDIYYDPQDPSTHYTDSPPCLKSLRIEYFFEKPIGAILFGNFVIFVLYGKFFSIG
ncbi:Uncharacterised protein [BD1-7 clade bacterium]|uniref:DUF3592 domain-containing protein n=1 Tax=BD1-7 clade bacterium TaxID=2029982 RepID=A0A5S9QE51_9GAMM|nr:Uncharacterised protein [BD1-7 clade bacterium]CAA0109808.1 Uncharacterised protein [BD1-7 clade bacterium]CAA0116687.1 Uncharacterised protein [BD1-7 clade bacterium]